MDFSNKYVLGFALVVCVVASGLVSVVAEALGSRIDKNQILDQRQQVIRVAGLAEAGATLDEAKVEEIFQAIHGKVVERKTGTIVEGASVEDVDPLKEARDPAASEPTPKEFRAAQVSRVPNRLEVFEYEKDGHNYAVLPIHGKGLWSTMYGFLAVNRDDMKVAGITFYSHGETPGLGGEIDNKSWQATWEGKSIYDASGDVALGVVKAGAQRDDQFQVDGLSGATITSKGVDATVKLWLGPAGYGPYLRQGN